MMYNIVRFRKNKPTQLIKANVSLEEAQKHCNDPATAGEDWFDGYREVNPKPKNYGSLSEACRLLLAKGDICHRVRDNEYL